VVGEQPVLKPGDKVIYVSGASLPTPEGSMGGSFRMKAVDATQQEFDALINPFPLLADG
jgi:ApaG protein